MPDHLPRIEHRHEPQSCQCKQCGSDLVRIGEDVTGTTRRQTRRILVHRHIRPQYSCRACRNCGRGTGTARDRRRQAWRHWVCARIVAAKYLDHLPLYRITQIAAREGVTLSLSTLAGDGLDTSAWRCNRWLTG
ncbi:MAG: IS66 family transposase zinc-finger binding domain-containing protein [Nitrosomonas sp.]|nr:IS66 family transposase zinc-finger binding domain-containing protein [Nitrosomonas sp.]